MPALNFEFERFLRMISVRLSSSALHMTRWHIFFGWGSKPTVMEAPLLCFRRLKGSPSLTPARAACHPPRTALVCISCRRERTILPTRREGARRVVTVNTNNDSPRCLFPPPNSTTTERRPHGSCLKKLSSPFLFPLRSFPLVSSLPGGSQ